MGICRYRGRFSGNGTDITDGQMQVALREQENYLRTFGAYIQGSMQEKTAYPTVTDLSSDNVRKEIA